MSEHPADTGENRLRATVAGALTFVSFGLLAALVLWIADFKTGAQATEVGQFTPNQIEKRDSNLIEIEEAQSALYDETKVDKAIQGFSGKKPKATETVVPGSETDLKNLAANAAKAEAEKAASEKAENEPSEAEEKRQKARKAKGRGAKAAAKGKAGAEAKAEQQN